MLRIPFASISQILRAYDYALFWHDHAILEQLKCLYNYEKPPLLLCKGWYVVNIEYVYAVAIPQSSINKMYA